MALSHQWFVQWSPPSMVISDFNRYPTQDADTPFAWNKFLRDRTQNLQDFVDVKNENYGPFYETTVVDKERGYKISTAFKKDHPRTRFEKEKYDGESFF